MARRDHLIKEEVKVPTHISIQDTMKKIDLDNGSSVVLLDRLGMEKIYGRLECARNVFMINAAGHIIWQVSSNFDDDSGPFTNIVADGAVVTGYRWDGGIYSINIRDGAAVPVSLMK